MRGYEVDEMVSAHCREVGMSKHKTAAEWGDRIRDGLKLTMVEVGELVADLAACEAELVLANNTVTDCETRMADIVAERDDLRRKLADVSLANAALREAYEKYIVVLDEGIHEFSGLAYVHGCIQSPELVERGNRCREEIAALPADGLAEEVKRDIQAVHDLCFEPKGLMQTSMSSTADADHAKAHRILDALLAVLRRCVRAMEKHAGSAACLLWTRDKENDAALAAAREFTEGEKETGK